MAFAAEEPARRRTRRRRGVPALDPVDSFSGRPLEQQIYAALRRALMSGAVSAGGGLSVRSIAEALGVSNAPVRDALKRLEADGALQARPRSAFYTAPISGEEYDRILSVRLRLEGLAAAEAASAASPRQIATIARAADAYAVASGDAERPVLSAANHAFHFAIYEASGNPVLVELISNLWVRLGPLLARVTLPHDREAESVGHHAAAVAAIGRGDAAAAEAAIHDDLVGAARSIRAAIARLERGLAPREAAPDPG